MKKAVAAVIVLLLYALVAYVIVGRQFDVPTPPRPTQKQIEKLKVKQKEIGGYTIITDEKGVMYYYNNKGRKCRITL